MLPEITGLYSYSRRCRIIYTPSKITKYDFNVTAKTTIQSEISHTIHISINVCDKPEEIVITPLVENRFDIELGIYDTNVIIDKSEAKIMPLTAFQEVTWTIVDDATRTNSILRLLQ